LNHHFCVENGIKVNQEDSLILNKSSIDRGLFRCTTVRKNPAEIVKNPSTSLDDIFTKPDPNKVTGMKQGNYNKLNEKGYIPEETPITNNDIIIGKISPIQPTGNNNKVYKDSSVQFKSKIDGVIDRVHTGIRNSDGYEMYNIRTRMERKPIIGDKFCLTPEHEVLTMNGFKSIDKITLEDKVACLDDKNNIYYTHPFKVYKYKHVGSMCKIETDKIELISTLEHKMYVRIDEHFELIEAGQLFNKTCYYKKNANGFEFMFKPTIYETNDKELADKISIQMFHAGFACDIIQEDNIYKLIYDYTDETLVDHIETINYYGYVYCIEVPHHVFYVRLNGKSCWTGNSNRHSQKATVGIILQEEDMPFTQDGMIPDMIMNPHCFVGETLISLPHGLSKRLDSFSDEGLEKVWSFDNNGIIQSYSKGMESKGIQDTIKLTFIDGREIICTPEHKFRVFENDKYIWKEAKDITFEDRIAMAPIGTEDVIGSDEENWSLEFGDLTFNMKNNINRQKSLAFARLLGFIMADGCVHIDKSNSCVSNVCLGTLIDANTILDDIELLTNKRPSITNDEGKHTTYYIRLPKSLSKQLNKLENLTTGRRTTQLASLPTFVLDSPKSIVREFLGGLFGGDGWMPHYRSTLKNVFTTVKFSQSICEEYQSSLEDKMNLICTLMSKLGVEAEIQRIRDCGKNCQAYIDRPRVSIEIIVKSNEAFRKNIGFRFCIEKALRLEVAACYENYCLQVKKQHDIIIKHVNEIMESNNKKNNDNFKCSPINMALEEARKELYKDTKVLNEYYSLLNPTLVQNRRRKNRSSTCNVFDYKYMLNAEKFLKMCGCDSWYHKKTYNVKRTDEYLPFYYLTIMKNEAFEKKEVFDIGVMHLHVFFANGHAVSNCMPTRMTAGQLIETLASKIGALTGQFIDGTPFNNFDARSLPEMLKKLGYEENGNETMYCGMTGKKIDAQIFIGPCYQIRLKHMVQDKVHGRARGPRQALTRQPLEGRSREGGFKIGKPFCLRVRMQILR
jgi:intein/homing endonuclease